MSFEKLTRRTMLYGPPAAAAALLAKEYGTDAVTVAGTASPKEYGAAGDGVTDDTAAINRCLAENRGVDFGGPDSTYLITGTLLVQQAAAQVVTGCGATIRAGAAVTVMRLKNAGHTVSGLRFDGANQPSGLGLIVESTAPGCRIDSCRFTDVAGSAVHVQAGAVHAKILHCTLENCGHGSAVASPYHSSIFIADADFCTVVDNDVLGCDWGIYFRGGSPGTGINFYQCRGNTLTCRAPAPAASQGISNAHGRHGRIEDNTIVGFADNGIDCLGCNNMTIAGNTVRGGKDGVFVGDDPSTSITISGNVFSGAQRGVRVLSATAALAGVVITGNTVSQPTDGAILVSEAGPARLSGITISDNDLHIGDAGWYGIKLLNVEVSRVEGNRIFRPRAEGILVDGVDIVELTGNTIQDAGTSAANTFDAIRVSNSNRVLVRGNITYGTARYAVGISGGTGMTVAGTRWRSMGTGGVSSTPAGTVLSDNLQF